MAGLASAWQGTEVTVFSADLATVDGLVEQVQSTARSAIDPAAGTIVYEIGDWPDALQNEFAAQLTISEVAYIWNEDGDIVVNEADEDLVEEVIDLLPSADSFDNVDGLEVQGLLNEAFMVCDRLASKPDDRNAVDALAKLSESLNLISLPFGFEQSEWDALIDAVAQVLGEGGAVSDKTRSKLGRAATKRLKNYI